MIWINSIWEGSKLFGVCVLPVYLAAVVLVSLITKKWNYVKALVMGFFLYYLCCVFALVFLPLPSLEEALELSYQVELMPLHCISDIAKTPLHGTLVVIFNILMTIPFGMFLRYYFGLDAKKVFLYTLALTTLIEFGQFSGFFFLFRGSYRLFEIDDLILNTTGGMVGYLIACKADRYLPRLELFERGLFRNGLRVACEKRRIVI